MRLLPVLLFCLSLFCQAPPSFAGPYEDAVAAENLGDYAEAIELHRRAVNQGSPPAMNRLGFLYEKGLGVPANPGEAAYWYQESARNGYPVAMFNIGILYRDGKGVPQNHKTAVGWFFRAADEGIPDAHYSLAQAYEAGNGIHQDFEDAAEHMFKSLQGGYDFAVKEMTTNANGWAIAFRRNLQRIMRDEGIYSGAIDGQFGPETQRAIRSVATFVPAQKPAQKKEKTGKYDTGVGDDAASPASDTEQPASPLDQLPDIEGLEELQ